MPFSNQVATSLGNGQSREEKLLALMQRTGMNMTQVNGQRTLGGPPNDWEGAPPPRGCEIFIGKLPRDMMEDELVPIFERIGRIYEFRLMMDFSGSNRGFAYVRFTNREDAKRACRELNNLEVRRGHHIGVVPSVDNCRLFVGGIHREKKKEDVLAEMNALTNGVVDVLLYPSTTDKMRNRGFAFVEYENHRMAAMARRKLAAAKICLWDHEIQVDWAEPEQDVDDETMSRVKVLYVRNLQFHTSEERIREFFEDLKPNSVERVKKIKDYAFVHFRERLDAETAKETLDGSELDGAMLEIVFSKPPERSFMKYVKNVQKQGGLSTLAPVGQQKDLHQNIVAAATYQAATQQVASIPIESRSNRLGRGAAGMRSAGARHAFINAVKNVIAGRYAQHQPEDALGFSPFYELTPNMVLVPTNPITLMPGSTYAQELEDYCARSNLGQPMYQLQSTKVPGKDGVDKRLFLYKVSIPMLFSTFGFIQPNKLCDTPEEAHELAAQTVLIRIRIPAQTPGEGAVTSTTFRSAHAQQLSTHQAQELIQPQTGTSVFGPPFQTNGTSAFPTSFHPVVSANSETMFSQQQVPELIKFSDILGLQQGSLVNDIPITTTMGCTAMMPPPPAAAQSVFSTVAMVTPQMAPQPSYAHAPASHPSCLPSLQSMQSPQTILSTGTPSDAVQVSTGYYQPSALMPTTTITPFLQGPGSLQAFATGSPIFPGAYSGSPPNFIYSQLPYYALLPAVKPNDLESSSSSGISSMHQSPQNVPGTSVGVGPGSCESSPTMEQQPGFAPGSVFGGLPTNMPTGPAMAPCQSA